MDKFLIYLFLLHVLITYISSCFPHCWYLHSINSYLLLPVSTPFEPTTIHCHVYLLFGYFRQQSAQPPHVFPTIMMSDPLGNLQYTFTPCAAYMVDTQEAIMLSGVAGTTSHLTLANYWQFGDDFWHPPCTAAITLKQWQNIHHNANPADLNQYIWEAMEYWLNGVSQLFWRDWPGSKPSTFSHLSHYTIGTKPSGTMTLSGASRLLVLKILISGFPSSLIGLGFSNLKKGSQNLSK